MSDDRTDRESTRTLFGRLCEALPREDAPAGALAVSAVLAGLGRAAARPVRDDERTVLEFLADRVDVSGKVYRFYGADRRPLQPREPLPLPTWRALAAAFLVCGQELCREGGDARGAGLKFLNSALNALDRCRDNGDAAEIASIEAAAAALLREVLDPRGESCGPCR